MTLMSYFSLFTSLRYDQRLLAFPWNTWEGNAPSPFLFLPYHYDRLLEAAQHFQWPDAIRTLTSHPDPVEFLRSLCQECVNRGEDPQRPLRDGELSTESFPTISLDHDLLYASTFQPDAPGAFQHPARRLDVYLDTDATPPSAYTAYKTTRREHYDAARARCAISAAAPKEVLLCSPAGEVTEGSVRSVAFWRGGRWVTPCRASGGLLAGTVRRWLLEQGRVVEGTVMRAEVHEGEWVLLSNGVEGCLLGVIVSTH